MEGDATVGEVDIGVWDVVGSSFASDVGAGVGVLHSSRNRAMRIPGALFWYLYRL